MDRRGRAARAGQRLYPTLLATIGAVARSGGARPAARAAGWVGSPAAALEGANETPSAVVTSHRLRRITSIENRGPPGRGWRSSDALSAEEESNRRRVRPNRSLSQWESSNIAPRSMAARTADLAR